MTGLNELWYKYDRVTRIIEPTGENHDTRALSRDTKLEFTVSGFDSAEVTPPAGETQNRPSGNPCVQFLCNDGNVVAEGVFQTVMNSSTPPAPEQFDDNTYGMCATLNLNNTAMESVFEKSGASVMVFQVRIFNTEGFDTAPIATGLVKVWKYPDAVGVAPVNLPSASEVLAALQTAMNEHVANVSNPHGVTAAQIGSMTQTQGDARYATLASVASAVGAAQAATAASQGALQNLNTHTGNSNNPHGVTKNQVGLGNVNNTADADKPVSTAQANAITAAVAALSAEVTASLALHYLKTETYSKSEVNERIALIPTMKIVVVDNLPSTGDQKTIYFKRITGGTAPSKFEEWIYVDSGWEMIGEQHDVDLTAYAQKTWVQGELGGYVAKVAGKGLSTNDYTSAEKTKLGRAVLTVNGLSADGTGNVNTKVLAATDIFDIDCNDWSFRVALASLWSKLGGTVVNV